MGFFKFIFIVTNVTYFTLKSKRLQQISRELVKIKFSSYLKINVYWNHVI